MKFPTRRADPLQPMVYNGPDTPSAYDANWQKYTNLTPEQIAWFQSQPEWQDFLAYVALSPKTAKAGTPVAVVKGALSVARNNPTSTAQFLVPKV